ncbi:MAG TPA: anti-sigma F factor [Candidatus Anaerobutyricum avicola]|nr:anti-sigma F factor [Candidatus Anaerobutyricum avicola]
MKTSIGDTNRLEAVFASSPENERISRVTAAAFAAVLNPTVEELSDFKTAVSEAVTNAIIHAYPEGRGEIRLTLERKKNEVTVHIRDFGVGIADIKKSMEPLYTTREDQERSGMGFTFMEAFTDHVEVESEPGRGTCVSLTKKMGGEKWNIPVR